MAGTTYGVLLGYDGSAGSDRALSWAAREAKSRGGRAHDLPGVDRMV
jgi:nucleotide-binding universal stress UspA family protein